MTSLSLGMLPSLGTQSLVLWEGIWRAPVGLPESWKPWGVSICPGSGEEASPTARRPSCQGVEVLWAEGAEWSVDLG